MFDELQVDAEEHLLNLQSAQNIFYMLNHYITKVEPTAITPKLLLPGANVLPSECFLRELTSEAAALLRHRLELKASAVSSAER